MTGREFSSESSSKNLGSSSSKVSTIISSRPCLGRQMEFPRTSQRVEKGDLFRGTSLLEKFWFFCKTGEHTGDTWSSGKSVCASTSLGSSV